MPLSPLCTTSHHPQHCWKIQRQLSHSCSWMRFTICLHVHRHCWGILRASGIPHVLLDVIHHCLHWIGAVRVCLLCFVVSAADRRVCGAGRVWGRPGSPSVLHPVCYPALGHKGVCAAMCFIPLTLLASLRCHTSYPSTSHASPCSQLLIKSITRNIDACRLLAPTGLGYPFHSWMFSF